MLEKVRYRDYFQGIDVDAYTDGYAYDEYSSLYLLSVAGHDSSVKAITSALVSGKKIEIESQEPLYLSSGFGQKYRILAAKLASGLLHQVALEDGFFASPNRGRRLLYIDNDEHAPKLLYDAVTRNYSVPLIPEWSEWLYEKLRKQNGLAKLCGTRKALKLVIGEEELDSIVSEGVRSHEIDF